MLDKNCHIGEGFQNQSQKEEEVGIFGNQL